ncbi:MAG: hypothetical protein WBF88_01670 [Pusillimonas sp.]
MAQNEADLKRQPHHPRLLTLRAHALNKTNRNVEVSAANSEATAQGYLYAAYAQSRQALRWFAALAPKPTSANIESGK